MTNGSKNASDAKSDTSVSSSLFTSKPATNINGGLFGMPPTSSAKPAFGTGASTFASTMSAPKTEIPSMTFHSSKADSTVGDSPFKMQSVSSSNDNNAKASTAQVSSTLFGVSSTSPNQPSFTSNNLSKQPVSSSTTPVQNSPANSTTAMATPALTNKTTSAEKEKEVARNKYYSKLKGLNESVSSWIVKHVDITPLCFLTPIFKDYENYLQVIQEEYEAAKKKIEDKAEQESSEKQATGYKENSTFASPDSKPTSLAPQESKSVTTLFGLNNTTSTTSTGLFGGTFSTNTDQSSKTSTPSKGFSFGITPATNSAAVPAKPDNPASPSQGFSFAAVTTAATSPVGASLFSSTANTGSPAAGFSFGISTSIASSPTNTASNATGASFSFGIGGSKPFSFSPQTQQSTVAAPEVEDEDQSPPKVEFTPVVEENSVFDKKCKIFVKKDGNFIDKGVGTLYIKKVEGNSKHQLLVRANTNLGTVLLNLILATAVPTQRMGKNNVMLVCIPTPDSKPPPSPVLIRVKTGEEADQLLETLNKYKS